MDLGGKKQSNRNSSMFNRRGAMRTGRISGVFYR